MSFVASNDPPSTTSHLLSCVIVNYRTPHFLIDCLPGLLHELSDLDAQVVIVDNDSQDGSADTLREWVRAHQAGNRVSVLDSGFNGGFSFGNNFGIRAMPAQYYLLLNSDTLIRPGAIHTLLDAAYQHPEAGILSPRLEWPDGTGQESCFRYPSPWSEFSDAAKTGVLDRLLARHTVAMPVQDSIARPEWTSFACVLIRSTVFNEIGLLDEGYFMYFEDVEFCLRTRHAGWDIVHDPAAHVVHLRGGSSPLKEQTRLRRRLPRYFYQSRTRFYRQSAGILGPTVANLMWWLGRLVSGPRQLLGRDDKRPPERQGHDIWTNWLHPLKPWAPPRT